MDLILLYGVHVLTDFPIETSSLKDFAAFLPLLHGALLTSITLTLFEVAVARYAMRWTIAARSEWPILLGMVLISFPIGFVLSFFLTITFQLAPGEARSPEVFLVTPRNVLLFGTATIALGCCVSTVLWGLLAIIAIMMLLHRIIWPLASRVLYALGRYRIVQNKAALNAAGATLAGIAITGAYPWESILKHFGFA